jgi:hypothetical protein
MAAFSLCSDSSLKPSIHKPVMKKFLVPLVLTTAVFVSSAQAQPVSNVSFYWNADTVGPTTSTSSVGAIGNYFTVLPEFSQFNNFGTTVLISNGTPSNVYNGASGGNNFGLAVGTLNSTDPRPFSLEGPAFAFTITLDDSSQKLSLTGFSYGSRRTGTGPQAHRLVVSEFADFSTSFTVFDLTTGQTNATWVFNNPTGNSFNAFTSTGNQVFVRLYGYNGVNNATINGANWRIDDITLSASVVPEPSTYLLIIGAAAGLYAFRRRRRSSRSNN